MPVRAPVTEGVKVTEIMQLACAARVLGDRGQVEVCAKSPVAEILVIVRGVLSLFCRVRVLAALVSPTSWFPNPRLTGDKTAGCTPVPVNPAVCGLLDALSVTVNVPVRAPVTEGLKVTEIVQLDRAAKVLGEIGQVEVCAKSPEVEIPEIVSGVLW
jgi:hypothetical protein